jgi:hypothetical protein
MPNPTKCPVFLRIRSRHEVSRLGRELCAERKKIPLIHRTAGSHARSQRAHVDFVIFII